MTTARHVWLMTAAATLCAVPLLALGQPSSGGSQMQGTPPQATPQPPLSGATGTTTGITTGTMAVDSARLRDGRRASKVIGANIYNENNERIGEVEDIIIPQAGTQPVAILSVGGFLGLGGRLVAVPYERLQHAADRDRWMLRGATRESLQGLPAYTYEEGSRRG